MKIHEIVITEAYKNIYEVAVDSSWIEDIDLDQDDDGNVIMTLLSGRMYKLFGVPQELYDEWLDAESKGKFWHEYMAGQYNTTRIA